MEYKGIRSKWDHSWRSGYRCLDRTVLCLPREESPSSWWGKARFSHDHFRLLMPLACSHRYDRWQCDQLSWYRIHLNFWLDTLEWPTKRKGQKAQGSYLNPESLTLCELWSSHWNSGARWRGHWYGWTDCQKTIVWEEKQKDGSSTSISVNSQMWRILGSRQHERQMQATLNHNI